MTNQYDQSTETSGQSYISIETEQYGTLLLRPYLVLRDLEYFQALKENESPRNFAVRLVYRNIIEPEFSIEEIESWDDDLLAFVTHTWANQRSDPWVISGDLSPFEALVQAFENYLTNFYAEIYKGISQIYIPSIPLQGVFEGVQTQLQQINSLMQGVHQQMNHFLQGIQQSLSLLADTALDSLWQNTVKIAANPIEFNLNLDIGRFFDNLPDFTVIAERLVAYGKAADALEEGGFSFLLRYWTLGDIARFVEIGSISPRVRSAVTTNRLLALTRSDEFINELEQLFNESTILRRRWKVLEQAIIAHKDRQYILSIPVLLAQVEGIFSDALVLKNLVVRVNGQLCAKDITGMPRLDRRGRPIQLHGLGQKVQNSDLQNEDILQGLAEFFVDYLVPERNGILHGNLTNYARAKLSVQLLLNVYLLAIEFNYYENETNP